MYRQATTAWSRTQTSGAWEPHRPSALQRVTYTTAPPGQALDPPQDADNNNNNLILHKWHTYLFHFSFQYQLFPILLGLKTLDFALLRMLLLLQLRNRLAAFLLCLPRLLCFISQLPHQLHLHIMTPSIPIPQTLFLLPCPTHWVILLFGLVLSLRGIATYTHRPQGVNSRLKTYLFNKSFLPQYFDYPWTAFMIMKPDWTYHASRFIFSLVFSVNFLFVPCGTHVSVLLHVKYIIS